LDEGKENQRIAPEEQSICTKCAKGKRALPLGGGNAGGGGKGVKPVLVEVLLRYRKRDGLSAILKKDPQRVGRIKERGNRAMKSAKKW